MAQFNPRRFTGFDVIVIAAGLVALVALFLPWWGISVAALSAGSTVSGWGSGYGWLGDILMIAAAVYLIALRSNGTVPRLPLGPFAMIVAASGLGTLLVAWRWIRLPRAPALAVQTGYNFGPRIGIVLAMAAGAVQLVAALFVFRASGEKTPWRAGNRRPY